MQCFTLPSLKGWSLEYPIFMAMSRPGNHVI